MRREITIFDKIIILLLVFMSVISLVTAQSTTKCYGLTDHSQDLHSFIVNPNGNPLPVASVVQMDRAFNGEGSAYRAKNKTLYAFQNNSNFSDLYAINVSTGISSKVISNRFPALVGGAEFYSDPLTAKEILYVISEEINSKLYAFYADSWQSLDNYPKNIFGDTTGLNSLALNPQTGKAYAVSDYKYDNKAPKLYEIDLETGKTIYQVTLGQIVDAEGLSFASDGNLYLEDELLLIHENRRLYQVNLQNGNLTPSAEFSSVVADLESLSCDGTAITAMAAPAPVPEINIETVTNGVDADTPTGPSIELGQEVKWTYFVTNSGNVALTNVEVTDNIVGNICTIGVLDVGASKSCDKISTALAGQYANIGIARGVFSSQIVTDDDPTHYIGINGPLASINLDVLTNGIDADTPTGPRIEFGQEVKWTYVVTNSGNVALTNIGVTDNMVGNICTIGTLAIGERKTCDKISTALAGQYANIGTARGVAPCEMVIDNDPTHYIGTAEPTASINLDVLTNGIDADTPTGPSIELGQEVKWTYVVTNSGNVALAHVEITDDIVGSICTIGALAVGERESCIKTGTAIEGQYVNIGTVKAKSPQNVKLEDTDPSHYIGRKKLGNPTNLPITNDDAKAGERCKSVILNILDNDSDVDNDLNISTVNLLLMTNWIGEDTDNDGDIDTVTVPNEGKWTVSNEGLLTYAPSNDCSANPTELRYNLRDEAGNISNEAIVIVAYPTDSKSYLGSFVWFDANRNGRQESGEIGLEGVVVELYDANGNLIGITTTNEHGQYIFVILDAGEYSLKFTLKEGYSFSPKDVENVNENIDSDADIQTGRTDSIILAEGQNNVDIDVGMYITSNPSIEIVKMTNGGNVNNIVAGDVITWTYVIKNTGNTVITNIIISDDKEGVVTDCNGNGSLNPAQSMTCTKIGTAIEGQYVNIGTVEANAPQNIKLIDTDTSGYIGGRKLGNPTNLPITNDDAKAGERCKSVILNILDNDSDVDNDLNISTVNLLLMTNWIGEDTDNDGDIDTVTVPNEGKWTVSNEGLLTYTPSNDCSANPTELRYNLRDEAGNISNEAIVIVAYPTDSKSRLGNFVWFDANRNGKQEIGEVGLEGVAVELYDANGNLSRTTTTNAYGHYNFFNLDAGEYSLKFMLKEGYSFSPKYAANVNQNLDSDVDIQTGRTDRIILAEGQNNVDIDVGMYITSNPSIEIVKMTNGGNVNNIVAGDVITWTYVIKNTGNTVITNIIISDDKEGVVTDCNGNGSLNPAQSMTCTKIGTAIEGQYVNIGTVEANAPQNIKLRDTDTSGYIGGRKLGNPTNLPVTNDDAKAGERCKSVILNILDNDSDVDNDLNISTVNLLLMTNWIGEDTDNDGDIDTVTVPNEGKWTVSNEGLLTYTPSNGCSANPTELRYNLRDEAGNISNEAIVIVAYPRNSKSRLGDFVWFDANRNGRKEIGEVGLEGVAVELYNANGNLIGTRTTNEYGLYDFFNLDAGEYRLKFTLKEGYSFSPKDVENVNENIDSDADIQTGRTDSIILAEGQNNIDIDAGMYITSNPSIEIVKMTNGGNVNNIVAGDVITWTYVITNTGNTVITNIIISDDKEGVVTDCNGNGSLNPAQSITCTKTGTAIEGQYVNIGTVEANAPQNIKLRDTDTSRYIGGKKLGNPTNLPVTNDDAKAGERCKSVILNILDNDSDVDNDLNISTVNLLLMTNWIGEDTDNDGDIDTVTVPNEGKWTVSNEGLLTYTPSNDCSANPTELRYNLRDEAGNISNEAIVIVAYPTDSKSRLGNFVWFDANRNGKQEIGEVGLEGVAVELYDANGNLSRTTTTNAYGHYNFFNLDAGEYSLKFMLKEGYSFSPKYAANVNQNLDSDVDIQTGRTDRIILAEGQNNVDIDVGMYITSNPSIEIVKMTNGGNVNNIVAGDVITWTYVIKNTGNTVITNIIISDDKEGVVTDCNGNGSLNPAQSMTCTKIGTAIEGQYVNIGMVVGIDIDTNQVSSTGTSSYVGKVAPALLGTVGDFVWLDSNKNGIQDNNELGLKDVIVQLFDETKKLIYSTQTDATGKYLFKDLLTGEYYAQFSVPNGYTVTLKEAGNDRENDSNGNANGKTGNFTLAAGDNDLSIDLGLYPTLTNLGDRVFLDTNANGIQDNDERQGVSGVNVKLYTEDNKLVDETETTSTGQYLFRNLIPANYYVIFDIPSNFKVSPKDQGSNESDDSDADANGKTDVVTLLGGQDNKAVDMGLYQEAIKIGDRVFYDTNRNGIQDDGETGVGGVEVKLYLTSNNEIVASTQTSASGIYLFDKVLAGEYYIIFTKPAGYTITEKGRGSKEKDSDADSTGRTSNFTLVAGTQDSSIDMGVYQDLASYGDRVFIDTNNNGIQDIGEKGVRDVNVTIYSATSNFSRSMLTDENGNYLFTHLPAGEYFSEFRNIPYGYLITEYDVNNNQNDLNDSDGFIEDGKIITEIALLTPGKNDLSWDLGIYKTVSLPGKSVLGNLVFEDFNKDGVQNIGERGVAAVEVTLFNNDTDTEIETTVTDENGLYEFTNVDPAFNYYIQFTVPAGFLVSPQDQDNDTIDSDTDETGRTEVIVLEANQINSTVDMGIYREGSVLGDKVFFDEFNGVSNGIQDTGEVGANDIKVVLYAADGTELKTTRTNASGEYHFTNVLAGRYTVGFSELPTGYVFTLANQGNDDEKDSDVNANGRTAIIVVDGQVNITSIDAGLKKISTGISVSDIKSGVTGQNVTLDVLANDTEGTFNFDVSTVRISFVPDGATLSEDGRTLTVPNEGAWSVNPDTGAITFTPEDGFIGDPTAISYTVEDTEGNEIGADVEVNYPPLAVDDNVNAQTGTQVIIYVLENDSNTSSPLDITSLRLIDPISGDEVETVSVLGQGTWSTNIDGSVTFTPDVDFVNNPTPIAYVISEVAGDVSNRATITIVYPDAVDDTVIVPVESTGEIIVNVSENDSNNTVATTVTIGCMQPGVNTLVVNGEGTWSIDVNGAIIFVPETGFIGEPTDIEYTIGLVSGERSNCATVDIKRELLAVDDRSTLNVGSVTLINILSNDFGSLNSESVRLVLPVPFVAGSTLSADGKVLTVPSEGVWSVNDLGIVSFTAEEGFMDVPTAIRYTVENNNGLVSNIANIILTIDGVLLVANDDRGTADGTANPVAIDVLNNDTGDLDRSSVRIITPNGDEVMTYVVSSEGTWTVSENGVITFTGESDFVGTPTPIRYIVYDNSLIALSDIATVTIDGTFDCRPYETSIPAMGQLAAFLMLILTLLTTMLFLKEEKCLVEKCYN